MIKIKRLSLNTKLLIYEYKERFPAITAQHVSELFGIDEEVAIRLFKQGEITVPSRMNSK
jgi:hypothetical protein